MRRAVIGGIYLIYLLLAPCISAQSTSPGVTCPSSFDWASNNLNQNICTIASYLRAACEQDPASFVLGAPASGHYGPPTTKDKCTCSMVYYNAINACALCQKGQTLSWKVSVAPCSPGDITVAGYPEPIPPGTAVPAWAFLDVSSSDVFDPTAAKDYASANDTMIGEAPPPAPPSSSPTTTPPATHSDVQTPQPSTPSDPQSASSAFTQSSPTASSAVSIAASSFTSLRGRPSPSATGSLTGPSGSILSVPTPASTGISSASSPSAQGSDATIPSGAESNTKHTSSTGAIVGGVVGGLAVVVALALVLMFLRRRRASAHQAMAADPFDTHEPPHTFSPISRIVRRSEKSSRPDQQFEPAFAETPHPTSSMSAQASVARLLPADGPPPEYASVAGR